VVSAGLVTWWYMTFSRLMHQLEGHNIPGYWRWDTKDEIRLNLHDATNQNYPVTSFASFVFVQLTLSTTGITRRRDTAGRRSCRSSRGWSPASHREGSGSRPQSSHLGFVVDKAELRQVFYEYFGYPSQSFIRPITPQLSVSIIQAWYNRPQ
jgi:hypothetical protein